MVLMPESRADKNGKIVTRHVRPDQATTPSKRAVPAPEVFSEHSQELARQVGMAVSDIGIKGYGMSLGEVMQSARRVPSETAQALLESRKYAIASSGFDYCLAVALRENAGMEHLENFALLYNDDQYYDLFENQGSAVAYKVIAGDIAGLKRYPELGGVTNFYRADEDTRRKAIALTAIIQIAEENDAVTTINEPYGSQTTFLTDQRLVQLTIENAGNLRQFLDLARERGCNIDALTEGMKTTAPLRNGAL
jgi:hypothetical protein